MFKKISCIFVLVSSFNLLAMDPGQSFHAPQFKEDILNFVSSYVEREKITLRHDVEIGALEGFAGSVHLPGFLATVVHSQLSNSCIESRALRSVISEGFAGTMLLFYPIALLFSLPASAAGAIGGLCTNICKSISVKIEEKEFDRHVVHHMYTWISVIKQGRLAIRAELEDWIKVNDAQGQSVSKAITAMLQGEKFEQYFGDFNFEREDMNKIIAQIGENNDNFKDIFIKISELVKISQLNEQEWIKLENVLINFPNKTDFPELSAEDIKTYLYVSVYYFTLVNNHNNMGIRWLKSLIS